MPILYCTRLDTRSKASRRALPARNGHQYNSTTPPVGRLSPPRRKYHQKRRQKNVHPNRTYARTWPSMNHGRKSPSGCLTPDESPTRNPPRSRLLPSPARQGEQPPWQDKVSSSWANYGKDRLSARKYTCSTYSPRKTAVASNGPRGSKAYRKIPRPRPGNVRPGNPESQQTVNAPRGTTA